MIEITIFYHFNGFFKILDFTSLLILINLKKCFWTDKNHILRKTILLFVQVVILVGNLIYCALEIFLADRLGWEYPYGLVFDTIVQL